jgi:NAD(P)-dependent dehydrogenase (short-subunit alcohol dehydrogenase family)
MSGRLSGRVAVITGGASGIGRATGLRIASEGCHVALIDIDEQGASHVAEECASAGVEAKAFGADVSVEAQIEAAIGKVVSHFNRMDILVANAGIEGAMRDFGDVTTAEWDRIMAVNVRGAFLTVRTCIPTMRAQHSGAIVLTASNYGLVATPHTTAYCTSKGAVAALGRALAVELIPDGIRVNCVCPGNVDTPMFDRALAMQVDDPARVKATTGRMAKPEEIASVIAFLASEDASYMTGAHVVIDYGETCRPGPVWPSPHWHG